MFDRPLEGQYMNTYTRLPFQEIAKMGDQLRKRSDESLAAMAATQDLMNLPVHSADVGFREADQQGFKNRLAGITKLHEEGKFDQAKRESVLLADELKTWKQQGRGYQMAQNYQDYQNNLKMIDSAVAKNVLSADRAAWEKEQLNLGYKGVGDLTDSGYNQYQNNLPAVIDKQFPEQASIAASNWQADKEYKLVKTADGAYYVNESGEKVSKDEVKEGILQYLDNPLNRAWAEREAEFKMRNLDPNQTSFDINGKTVTRDELKQQLIQEQFDSAAEFAANKAGYTRTSATLTYDQHLATLMKARAAQEEAKNTIDSFSPFGKGEDINLTSKNVDDLRKSVSNLKTVSKDFTKRIDAFKKQFPNVSADKNNPNYNPQYAELIAEQEKTNLQLTEHESYLMPAKNKANKLISANVGNFQFLDLQNPADSKYDKSNPSKGGVYHNPIYGLVDRIKTQEIMLAKTGKSLNPKAAEFLQEVNDGKPPHKMNEWLREGIKDGKSMDEMLTSIGLSETALSDLTSTSQGQSLYMTYTKAKKEYEDAIETSMTNDPARVDGYRMIVGIENGKYGSANAALMKRIEDGIAATAGKGYSSVDGRQLNQYMEEELGASWSSKYAKYRKEGKVKVYQTSGYSASGKPILNLSITDDEGTLHNIPILSDDSDMYLKTGREMASSQYPDTRQLGETMIKNAAQVGTNTVGSIVKGSGMESMFYTDERTNQTIARETVKSPLYGFKQGGSQLYVAPMKSPKGASTKAWQIVDSNGKVIQDNIGGPDDLRNILYNKVQNIKESEGDQNWLNIYGLGK